MYEFPYKLQNDLRLRSYEIKNFKKTPEMSEFNGKAKGKF